MPKPAVAGVEPAAAVFQCAAETFILLLYRRLDLTAALTFGQIRVAGNLELDRGLLPTFKPGGRRIKATPLTASKEPL